jgi:hypothetical protein
MIFMLFIPVLYMQLMEVWVRQTQLNSAVFDGPKPPPRRNKEVYI